MIDIPVSSVADLLIYIQEYGVFVVYLSVVFLGEWAIFLSSMIITGGHLTFTEVFVLSFCAGITADLFWFFIGRYAKLSFVTEKVRLASGQASKRMMNLMFGDNVFLSILLLKFFYGTRLISLFYFARGTISATRFIVYDTIGNVVYVFIFMILGISTGELLVKLFPESSLKAILIVGGLGCLCLFILLRWWYLSSRPSQIE